MEALAVEQAEQPEAIMTHGDLENIILVTIDCGRQDHLYTAKAETPCLDRLAEEAVVFTNAFSQTNTTIPSHVSLFTSRYLCDHGIYSNFHKPWPGAMSLPAILHRHGWHSHAFTGIAFLSYLMGDWCLRNEPISWLPTLENPQKRGYGLRKLGIVKNRRTAAKTIDKVMARLSEDDQRRFYWIHFFDAHMPYRPPRQLLKKYFRAPAHKRSLAEEIERHALFVNPSLHPLLDRSRPISYYPAAYAAAIEYIDSQLGRLIAFLKHSEHWQRTLFIVTSDHGENLLENGVFCDHCKLFDETTKVPLYWYDPAFEGNRVVMEPVQHVDLLPSILQRLRVEVPGPIRGHSFLPLLEGDKPSDPGPIFSEHAKAYQFSLRNREWQYIWKNPEKDHGRGLVLEDRFLVSRNDAPGPDGYPNQAEQHPDICERMKRCGQSILAAPLKDDTGKGKVSPALVENLQALGYL